MRTKSESLVVRHTFFAMDLYLLLGVPKDGNFAVLFSS